MPSLLPNHRSNFSQVHPRSLFWSFIYFELESKMNFKLVTGGALSLFKFAFKDCFWKPIWGRLRQHVRFYRSLTLSFAFSISHCLDSCHLFEEVRVWMDSWDDASIACFLLACYCFNPDSVVLKNFLIGFFSSQPGVAGWTARRRHFSCFCQMFDQMKAQDDSY